MCVRTRRRTAKLVSRQTACAARARRTTSATCAGESIGTAPSRSRVAGSKHSRTSRLPLARRAAPFPLVVPLVIEVSSIAPSSRRPRLPLGGDRREARPVLLVDRLQLLRREVLLPLAHREILERADDGV